MQSFCNCLLSVRKAVFNSPQMSNFVGLSTQCQIRSSLRSNTKTRLGLRTRSSVLAPQETLNLHDSKRQSPQLNSRSSRTPKCFLPAALTVNLELTKSTRTRRRIRANLTSLIRNRSLRRLQPFRWFLKRWWWLGCRMARFRAGI